MAQHPLYNWKQYLTDDDYNYLIQYVENVKNNIPNDKMLILSGPGSTGKSTLMDNISLYLEVNNLKKHLTNGIEIKYKKFLGRPASG